MHIVGPLHLQTPNQGLKTVPGIYWEKKKKNIPLNGPAQFKPVLFRGQLYLLMSKNSMSTAVVLT